ncbi:hypothetical protein BJV74DRAFT_871796 [Russula compacta]|nr:hypothetical protein BJV74DRAFT_871796 [Russula compacta]
MVVSHHGDGTCCLVWHRHTPRGGHGRTRYRNDVLRLRCVYAHSPHSSMPPMYPSQCLTSSVLLISSLILVSYFFAQFPHAPQGYSVHPSLDSLGQETKAKVIYPEDYYSGGAYVSLPFGNIVLIHGLSIPSLIWKDVAPALASRGYRLALLMQHVKWPRAYVAGVSMGGGILAAFTSFFPDLVDSRVALIAPTGLVKSKDLSKITKFMSSPFVQSVTSSAPFRVR